MHTIAHYGFIVASTCSGISSFIVLLMLVGIAFSNRPREVVWQAPAVFVALGAFWGLVAFGLNLL
jgi:hypothetical protein